MAAPNTGSNTNQTPKNPEPEPTPAAHADTAGNAEPEPVAAERVETIHLSKTGTYTDVPSAHRPE